MKNKIALTPIFLDEPVPGLEDLWQPDWTLNKPELPHGDRLSRMSVVHEAIAGFAEESITSGQRPVSIAGDCCTSIGMLAGLQRAGISPTLIWLDAHGDFNTMETTPSGFLGGMPLALIVGKGELTLPAAVDLRSLPENHVVLSDGRDLDPPEKLLLDDSDVLHLTDPLALLTRTLPERPIYVHFDVDVVSLDESPAQNYPAPGGPSVSNLRRVFDHLAATGKITAISMSTWNPELDHEGKSKRTSMDLLAALMRG